MQDEDEFELGRLSTPAQYQEVVFAYHLAQGWNPSPLDWKVEQAIDGYKNFLVWTFRGEHFMVCSFVKDKQRKTAFWGCYTVNPKFRGLGMALPLFKAQFDRLVAKGYRVIAASVREMTSKYVSRLDMKVLGQIREFKVSPRDFRGSASSNLPLAIGLADLQDVADYDQKVSGSNRKKVLEVILAEESFKKWAVKKDGAVAGYVFLVFGVDQPRLTPLLADSEDVAEALIAAACACLAPDQQLIVDSPSPPGDHKMAEFWERLGFTATGHDEDLVGQTDFPNDFSKTFTTFSSEYGL